MPQPDAWAYWKEAFDYYVEQRLAEMTNEMNEQLFRLTAEIRNWKIVYLYRGKDDALITELDKIISRMAGYGMVYNGNTVTYRRYS